MTGIPGRLTVQPDGRVAGPASIVHNVPWPCVNGSWGSGKMRGVVEHTMQGDLPGTIAWFNKPEAQASAHFGIGQQGNIHQFGPVGKGWIAWAQAGGNAAWYSVEHADAGDPRNPLTGAQIAASAQVTECLSAFAGFPLQVTDDVNGRGLIWHGAGGQAWGGHLQCPGDARKAQRPAIIELARQIRAAGAKLPPGRHVMDGAVSMRDLCGRQGCEPADIWWETAKGMAGEAGFGPRQRALLGSGDWAGKIGQGTVLWLP